MTAIHVANLEKRYGDALILERVGVEIAPGSFVSLVGASGCGKTTFLKIILGQERASAGTVLIDGAPLAPEPTPDRGIVFQRYSVFPHLTALQNLMLVTDLRAAPFAARAFGAARRAARDEAEAMLLRVGLGHARKLYPASLSGGMQQRLAIAQTLLGKPKVLLLDEPFGALDPGIKSEMHELLTEIWTEHGMTVLMVTHDIGEAFKLGTRVLVFSKVRRDPQAPGAYGATISYDIAVDRSRPPDPADVATVAAALASPRAAPIPVAAA